jgi:sporulation protein YunB
MVAKKPNYSVRRRVLLAVFILLALIVLAWQYALNNLNAILISMAEARARQLAIETINRGVGEVMEKEVAYADLVSVVTDAEGRVSMLQANTMRMNALASEAALATQRNLGQLADQGVRLPFGAALGIGLFSASGPQLRVEIIPVGSVTTQFVTTFESAGINQVRHSILLETTTTMRIVVPTGADTISVRASIPVAESIIVGQVPSSYINVPPEAGRINLLPQ